MANLEVLNVHDHAVLRLAAPTSHDRHFVQVVTSEFESVAARFPILFCKNAETGEFYAGAMLGFKPGEHIAHGSPDGADANRLFDIARQGFFIAEDNIAIDRAHARFAGRSGEPLFEDGRPTASLRRAQAALQHLHTGVPRTDLFLRRLLALKVIEPIDLSFDFDDGERLVLEGLYTVSRDALADLDDTAALELFHEGDLAYAYAAIGSLQHLSRLARLRNDGLSAG